LIDHKKTGAFCQGAGGKGSRTEEQTATPSMNRKMTAKEFAVI
jgi:hypothetical protein